VAIGKQLLAVGTQLLVTTHTRPFISILGNILLLTLAFALPFSYLLTLAFVLPFSYLLAWASILTWASILA
jgi:hypothetical protein